MDRLNDTNRLMVNKSLYDSINPNAFNFFENIISSDVKHEAVIVYKNDGPYPHADGNKLVQYLPIKKHYEQVIINKDEDVDNNIKAAIQNMINENHEKICKTISDYIVESCDRNFAKKFKWYHTFLQKYGIDIFPAKLFTHPNELYWEIKKSCEKLSEFHKMNGRQQEFFLVTNNRVASLLTHIPAFIYNHTTTNNTTHLDLFGVLGTDVKVYVNNNLPIDDDAMYIYMKPKHKLKWFGGFTFTFNSQETSLLDNDIAGLYGISKQLGFFTAWNVNVTCDNLDEFTDIIAIKDASNFNFFQKFFKFLYK